MASIIKLNRTNEYRFLLTEINRLIYKTPTVTIEIAVKINRLTIVIKIGFQTFSIKSLYRQIKIAKNSKNITVLTKILDGFIFMKKENKEISARFRATIAAMPSTVTSKIALTFLVKR
ncbi:hypothetical protein GCM10022410_04290 [Amphibacillus indicireducens]|uniref:Uncharacterized protein n=1 Tax=Amphibacillus indicireducens TaxID=1076330 RepID=A0ABP7V606_9BACI